MLRDLLSVCLLSLCILSGCKKDNVVMDAYYYILKNDHDTKQYLRPDETLSLDLGESIDIYLETNLNSVRVHGPGDEILEVTRKQTDAANPRTFYRCFAKRTAISKLVIADADASHMMMVPLEIRSTRIGFSVYNHSISGSVDDPDIDLVIREEIENKFYLTDSGHLTFDSLTHGEAEVTWINQSIPSKGKLEVNDQGRVWIYFDELDFPVHYYEISSSIANFSYDLTDYFKHKYPTVRVQGIIINCSIIINGRRPLAPLSE